MRLFERFSNTVLIIDLPTPIGCGRLLIFDFLVDEDVEELEAKILAVVDVLLKCER